MYLPVGKKKENRFARILILGIVVMLLVLGFATATIGYREFTNVLEQQYNNSAYEVAETARNYLNPDRFGEYLKTGKTDDEYDMIQRRLDDLVVSSSCSFIYVAAINDSYTTSTYIYDSVNPSTGFTRYPFGYVADDLDAEYTEELKHILTTGGRAEKYLYSYSESGAHTTAGLAVKDSNGKIVAVLGVEKPMSILEEARQSYVRHVAMATAFFIFLTLLVSALFLRRNILVPIREVTEEKKRMDAELNVAAKIQADMLPSEFPAFPDRKEFDIAASMTPAREVGGDFYDFFFIDENHFAMVMADVSGKGVPAALFMVTARTLIKNQALRGDSPAKILASVNEQLCEGNKAELFVTVWLAILDLETGKGVAANAGHEHPALCRAGGLYELVVYRHSPAVAAMEGIRFREHEFELHRGDSLFVYTDGVPEAGNTRQEMFGTERMLQALNQKPEADMQETLKNVRKSVEAFAIAAEQSDDITMLGFRYYGPADTDGRQPKG